MTSTRKATRARMFILIGAAIAVLAFVVLTYLAVMESMRLTVVENYINGKAPQRNAAEQEGRDHDAQQDQKIADLQAQLCAAIPTTCGTDPS